MKDLTNGHEGKLILNFAIPMLLGNVFQQLYSVINSVIVGHFLGKQALAAVGASFPIIFALISLTIGIATGCTIVISQFYGAKDIDNVRRTIDTMNIFLFFASAILTVAGILLSKPIFRLINLPDEIMPQAVMYFSISMLGTIPLFGYHSTSAILRGLGDSKTPLYFLIISTVVNALLDLLFIVVFKWGIAGAAIATVLAQTGAFFTTVIYLNRTHKIIRFSFFNLVFDKNIFIKGLKIGLPTGFQQTFVAFGMMALYWIVNGFGTDVIAAYSVVGRIDAFASMPAMNFGAALSTFVGQNIGARKTERVRSGLIATIRMSSIIALSTTAIVILFPHAVMHLFTTDAAVIEIGQQYLAIVGSFYIVFSTMFVVAGVMRGAGDTLIPMFITLFSLWLIRIPLAYFLSRHIGATGIWWAIPIAWVLGVTASFIYYSTGRWKTKSVITYSE
ncbi:MAG: MATE family efflux transporter [Bacteroidota bacterium]|nr:MATE family efflux transporter [Bacteroidota bacterium]